MPYVEGQRAHYKTAGTVSTARYMTVGRLQSDNYGSAILCITTYGGVVCIEQDFYQLFSSYHQAQDGIDGLHKKDHRTTGTL